MLRSHKLLSMRAASQSTRRSPRLKEIQNLNRQRPVGGKRQTKSSFAPTQQYQYFEKKHFRARHNAIGTAQQVKRGHSIDSREQSNHDAKRVRHSLEQFTGLGTGPDKRDLFENWLDESCRQASTNIQAQIQKLSDDMPRNTAAVLPSPGVSFENTTSISRKSERSAASVHDTDYRQCMHYRNIYIEREDPPVKLMQRARRIISRPRISPEMNDDTAEGIRLTARRLQDEGEDKIIKQLVPDIIPALSRVPDQRLEMNSDQVWSNSVPLPLDPDVLTKPLPLPRPKPDLAFGYSETAFNHKQLMTLGLLVDDQFGRSYVVPDQKLRFPFLDVEFKSQAKNGTHYVATNQAAGAGAIALNGNIELMQRSFGMEGFDYEEPRFFSVTMDHQLACVNVHWLRAPATGEQYSFHVEGLSQHLLKDADGIRAITRAVKNILDYGADERLRTLCKALDAYREIVLRDREAANPHSKQRNQVQPELKPEPRRSRRLQQQQYDEQIHQTYGPQSSSNPQKYG
ncbi:MAG: hypothetical protein Q9214_002276, partial [Letrouitia sp. 1 TL-2023]